MRELIYTVAASLDGSIAGLSWNEAFTRARFEGFPEAFPAHRRACAVGRHAVP